MGRWTKLECDVASPICLVLFPVASECETLRNVADDGGLEFDGLDINQRQHAGGQKSATSLASSIAASHFCKCDRTRARLTSACWKVCSSSHFKELSECIEPSQSRDQEIASVNDTSASTN